MRSSLRHILSQPFVVATGFAALVHSTWSLATLFNGAEPSFGLPWLLWVAPALLIALSIDVGQVVTASEIRSGQRSRIKLATFGVFAVFTYGLQWYHLAHHIPMLDLAQGVRSEWRGFASLISDAMVFLVPALLPLSTLLYTFSSEHETAPVVAVQPQTVIAQAVQVNVHATQPQTVSVEEIAPVQIAAPQPDGFAVRCDCGWKKVAETQRSAPNSLVAHQRHCKIKSEVRE